MIGSSRALAAALLLAGASLLAPAVHNTRTAQPAAYPTFRRKSKNKDKPSALSQEGAARIEKAQAKRDRKAAKLALNDARAFLSYHPVASAAVVKRFSMQTAA